MQTHTASVCVDGRASTIPADLLHPPAEHKPEHPYHIGDKPHGSVGAAKRAETASYNQQKGKMGGDTIRGAGHTNEAIQ